MVNANTETKEWGELDNEADTADEAEIAIRVFPAVLRETRPGGGGA